ncbi:hypothetical protein AB6B38_14085 (plasmid) [Glycocaulis abyssi]|jgi:hypothetical protein|uniref:Uncharacterized protein n=1 Tax=Glycocaulis abyssi TaxID=1433403 RepID=A0ABV9NGF9_9PROT|nr:hypothetical protein [Oceanicaulis sp.]
MTDLDRDLETLRQAPSARPLDGLEARVWQRIEETQRPRGFVFAGAPAAIALHSGIGAITLALGLAMGVMSVPVTQGNDFAVFSVHAPNAPSTILGGKGA